MRSTLMLSAALLCLAAAASAQSLTTTFSNNAGSSSYWQSPSVSFDLNVTNPAGVVIDSLAVNVPYVGIPGKLELYTTVLGGTSVGYQIAPPAGYWLLRTTGSMVSAGSGTPAAVTLDKPVRLPFGSYGVYIVHRGCGVSYTNGSQLVYGNADLTLTMGGAQATAFTSTVNTPRIANLTINYSIPADFVDFAADPLSGSSPLPVNFTDWSSVTSGTVLGYEWDFENDGTVDSTVQNPTAIYPTCGDYSPRLRILTSSGTIERIWTDRIAVDPLVANFTMSTTFGPPPLSVQFTDASTGALAWAWDFDGDGTVDDTSPNPSWVYGAGSYTTKLTVYNGCRVATTAQRVDSVTDSWTTNYTATHNLIAKQALAFLDLVVTSSEALVLTALDVNTIVHITQPCPIKVWLTDGTANGKQQNAAAWREVAYGDGTSVGGNNPTRITLNRPILLLPGRTYGIAVNYLDAHAYYNSPGSATMSHPDFTVNFWGVNTATTPFSTTPTTRQWNGGFFYTKVGSWPIGAVTPFGLGCPGTLGVPALAPVGDTRPKLGTTWFVQLDGMPLGAAVLVMGLSNAVSAFGPLPLDLGVFGMPGCTGYVSPDVPTFLIASGPSGQYGATFPAVPSAAGLQFYMQGLVLDPSSNARGAVMSDALAFVTGVY